MPTESFHVDHDKLKAPCIRLAGTYFPYPFMLPDVHASLAIRKFDIRFISPNSGMLDSAAMHSIEHLFAYTSRDNKGIIDFSPMGCRTGFYLTFVGIPAAMRIFVLDKFKEILTMDEVPCVSHKECGNFTHHNLELAKASIALFLENFNG